MKVMKNLVKKIAVLALVGVIVSSSTDAADGIATCGENPNHFIEVTSIDFETNSEILA